MFYLTQFFQLLAKYPLRGVLFLFLNVNLILSVQQFEYLKIKVEGFLSYQTPAPYFWALTQGDQDLDQVARKLSQLPGVKSISLKKGPELKARVEQMFKEMDLELSEVLTEVTFSGLKVELETGIEKRSQALIREYLIRLVGKENATLGPVKIKYSSEIKRGNHLTAILRVWGGRVIIGLNFFLWSLAYFWLFIPLKQLSFLIETFQRRKLVSFKILSAGLSGILLVVTIFSWALGVPSLPGSLLLILFFAGAGLLNLKMNYENFANL